MSTIVTVKSVYSDQSYQFVNDGDPKRGGVKDVYFSPKRDYVVAIFRDKLDENQKERLRKITSDYFNQIKNKDAGEYYLEEIFRWPSDVIEYQGRTGVIVPVYNPKFFFKKGYRSSELIKGQEKNGKWFAAPKFRHFQYPLNLDQSELGDWLSYFQICVNIARGVKKMHQMGLAHSDLSYNNVLVDPVTRAANIIDLDGLVVPGVYPPEVVGTADFIAPEVLASKYLPKDDPNRKLPRRETDLHALAVLVYIYLLRRHPLKGGKVHDLDPEKDDLLSMGEKALFIEHPDDHSNRPRAQIASKWDMPWADVSKLPYTLLGPYLKQLFDQAFIEGLHNPSLRPPADAWEQALLKTTDLMQPCANPVCEEKWYVFDNTVSPKCPFCGTKHEGTLPVLDLYFEFKPNVWRPENHRLMVYHNQYLFRWHVNRNVIRNERLTAADKVPVAYFTFHNKRWVMVNQKLDTLRDVNEGVDIPLGAMVELTDGKKLLLSREDGGRLVYVSLANKAK